MKPDVYESLGYTAETDIPSEYNALDTCDVSCKTTGTPNAVCMGDALRVFDSVSKDSPLHMVVIIYKQNDLTKMKCLKEIVEVDLTASKDLLFGELTREEIEELVAAVRAVPQKKKPTADERKKMYAIRDKIQVKSGAIHFDIKCNSQQSRLQCSFNKFQKFLKENEGRIVARSDTEEFRGGKITKEIASGRRTFRKKKATDTESH